MVEALSDTRVVTLNGARQAGKSTLARELGWRLGAPVIGSDRTRKWLAGLRPTDAGDPFIYGEMFSRRTYQEVFRRASVVLESCAPGPHPLTPAAMRMVPASTEAPSKSLSSPSSPGAFSTRSMSASRVILRTT